jgi:hypothetical protein
MSRDDFVRELEGCITERNQQAKISPEKLKEMWAYYFDSTAEHKEV